MNKAPTLTITRDLPAPPDQVFDAWLDPAWLCRWMFGPGVRDETLVHLQVDARPGGRFSFAVRRHGRLIEHVGEYLVVDRPQRLAFTWEVAGESTSRVSLVFAPLPDGTHLVLQHTLDPAWADFAERTRAGWTTMLDMLQRALGPTEGFARLAGPHAVQLQRMLPGPIERVWDYLTLPELRSQWLAGGLAAGHVGGAIELHFRHAELSPHRAPPPPHYRFMEAGHAVRGHVTRCEPPRLLAHTWDDGGHESEVSFELAPVERLVLLTLTHRRVERARLAGVAGGWHTHLAMLVARLNGETPPAFWALHEEHETAYRQRFEAS